MRYENRTSSKAIDILPAAPAHHSKQMSLSVVRPPPTMPVSLFVDTRVCSPVFRRTSPPSAKRRELVRSTESLWALTGALISLTMARQPIEAQLPVGAPLRKSHDVTLAGVKEPSSFPAACSLCPGRPMASRLLSPRRAAAASPTGG